MNIQFIRKLGGACKTGYRTESATANFFKDSKLLDQGVTYSIIHLSKSCILVQYIDHIATLDTLMNTKIEQSQIKKLITINESAKITKILGNLYQNEKLTIKYQLNRFFHRQEREGSSFIQDWWKKYTNFVRTYAQWCFLGFVVGLGDRHSNNILVREDGKVIHIDFQFIFDTGKLLGFPQWIPFRLTKGLLNQLSVIEPHGLIYSEFVKTALKYKEKSRQIWHALCHFSYMKKKNMFTAIDKRASLNDQPYEQAKSLIETATSDMLLRDMFIGWGSYK